MRSVDSEREVPRERVRLESDLLFSLVYRELRGLAGRYMQDEPLGQTLQTTALVHEAYLRLAREGRTEWESIGQFMHAAAEAMRRILVDRARARGRLKRGGGRVRVPLDPEGAAMSTDADDLLLIDEALTNLEAVNPEWASVVKLRYFAGLTHEQTAEAIGSTVDVSRRRWMLARAWLFRRLKGERLGGR